VSGWVSGGSAYVSVTLNQASPGNTAQTTTPTGGSNNGNTVIWAPTTECPTTSTNLWNGAQVQVNGARVTSINLRAEPNLGGRVITQIPAGTVLTVSNGPTCGNTWLWWRTSYQGHTGYVGEVNNEGHSNIVAVGGIVVSTTGQVGSGQSIVTVSVQHFGQTYNFQVNTRTCGIINGADIVVQEIRRFNSWSSGVTDMLAYFRPNDGQIESFRHLVENTLTSQSGCSSIYYMVGTRHYMDTSGLGNIVFGFYMVRTNQTVESIAANVEQGVNRDSFLNFWDNPDDFTQRRTGRRIAEAAGGGSTIDDTLIEWAADQAGLN